MNLAPDALARRRAAWQVFSDFYLDTDPAEFHDSAARDLARLPFSLDELERILVDEVHPALCGNLLIVAGEWSGFDADWVADRIRRQQSRPRWLRPRGRLLRWMARDTWKHLAPRIRDHRAAMHTAHADDAA